MCIAFSSLRFPEIPFPQKFFKFIAWPAAFFLLLAVSVDYISAGPIRADQVIMTNITPPDANHPSQEKMVMVMPIRTDNQVPGATYHLHIPFHSHWFNRLFKIHLNTDHCIRKLEIDKNQVVVPNADTHCIPSTFIQNVQSAIDITIENKKGTNINVSFIRDRALSFNQSALLVGTALYLLSLTAYTTWKALYRFNVRLLVIGLFLFSSVNAAKWDCPYGYGTPYLNPPLSQWSQWFEFWAYGPLIILLVTAGTYWRPTRILHEKIDSIIAYILSKPGYVWAWICSILFLIITCCLFHVMFGGVPHVADTHIHYVMSKIYAEGKLYDASHAFPSFFEFQWVTNDGKYYGPYFPGQAILLALGNLAHIPWIVNPLFGALTVYMVYLLTREISDQKTGIVAALLLLVSPHVLVMSSEYMAHATCMFFLTTFVYCYIRLLNTNRLIYALLAGICVGCALVIRVQAAVPFAAPIAIHAIVQFFKSPRAQWKPIILMGFTCSFFIGFLLYYNYATTGSLWITPYQKASQTNNISLFQFLEPSRWLRITDDIKRAFGQVPNLHVDLMGWPASPFIFILLLYWLRLQPRYANLLFSCFIGMFIGLIFIAPYNSVFPSRMVYESTALLIVLIAIGITRLAAVLGKFHYPYVRSSFALTFIILLISAWPYRIRELYEAYSNNYWEGHASYHQMLMNSLEKPALVFMPAYEEYRLVYFEGPPRDSNPVIFARDRGEENKQLMDYYPNRHAYIVKNWNVHKIR